MVQQCQGNARDGNTLRCLQVFVGDRAGAKGRRRAMGAHLEDLDVPGTKEGKQRWGSEDWETLH